MIFFRVAKKVHENEIHGALSVEYDNKIVIRFHPYIKPIDVTVQSDRVAQRHKNVTFMIFQPEQLHIWWFFCNCFHILLRASASFNRSFHLVIDWTHCIGIKCKYIWWGILLKISHLHSGYDAFIHCYTYWCCCDCPNSIYIGMKWSLYIAYIPQMSINHIYVDACLFHVCLCCIAYPILIIVTGILYLHHIHTMALYVMIQPIRPSPLTLIFYNYAHVITEFKWTISPSFRHYMFHKTIRFINNPYQNWPVYEHRSNGGKR